MASDRKGDEIVWMFNPENSFSTYDDCDGLEVMDLELDSSYCTCVLLK